jgi:hypothetical protein
MTINDIFTAPEAAQLWGLDASTVKKACQVGRFTTDEARKSGGTWMITREGMNRAYGNKNKENSNKRTIIIKNKR